MCLQLLLFEGKVSLRDTWAWISELCLLPPPPLGRKINKLKEQGGYKYWGGSWYAAEQGSEVGLLVTPCQLKTLSLMLHFIDIDISVYNQVKRQNIFHIDKSAAGARIYFRSGTIPRILVLRQVISLGFCIGCSRVIWFRSQIFRKVLHLFLIALRNSGLAMLKTGIK